MPHLSEIIDYFEEKNNRVSWSEFQERFNDISKGRSYEIRKKRPIIDGKRVDRFVFNPADDTWSLSDQTRGQYRQTLFENTEYEGVWRRDKQTFTPKTGVISEKTKDLIRAKLSESAKQEGLFVKDVSFNGNHYDIDFHVGRHIVNGRQIKTPEVWDRETRAFKARPLIQVGERHVLMMDYENYTPESASKYAKVVEGQGKWELKTYFTNLAKKLSEPVVPSTVDESHAAALINRQIPHQLTLQALAQRALPEGFQLGEKIIHGAKWTFKVVKKGLPGIGLAFSVNTVANAENKPVAAALEVAGEVGGKVGFILGAGAAVVLAAPALPAIGAGIAGAVVVDHIFRETASTVLPAQPHATPSDTNYVQSPIPNFSPETSFEKLAEHIVKQPEPLIFTPDATQKKINQETNTMRQKPEAPKMPDFQVQAARQEMANAAQMYWSNLLEGTQKGFKRAEYFLNKMTRANIASSFQPTTGENTGTFQHNTNPETERLKTIFANIKTPADFATARNNLAPVFAEQNTHALAQDATMHVYHHLQQDFQQMQGMQIAIEDMQAHLSGDRQLSLEGFNNIHRQLYEMDQGRMAAQNDQARNHQQMMDHANMQQSQYTRDLAESGRRIENRFDEAQQQALVIGQQLYNKIEFEGRVTRFEVRSVGAELARKIDKVEEKTDVLIAHVGNLTHEVVQFANNINKSLTDIQNNQQILLNATYTVGNTLLHEMQAIHQNVWYAEYNILSYLVGMDQRLDERFVQHLADTMGKQYTDAYRYINDYETFWGAPTASAADLIRYHISLIFSWALEHAKSKGFVGTRPAKYGNDLQSQKQMIQYLSEKNSFENHLTFWIGYAHTVLGVAFDGEAPNPSVWASAARLTTKFPSLISNFSSNKGIQGKISEIANEGKKFLNFIAAIKTNPLATKKLFATCRNAAQAFTDQIRSLAKEKIDIASKLNAHETDPFQQALIAVDVSCRTLVFFVSRAFLELSTDAEVQDMISDLYKKEKIVQVLLDHKINYQKNDGRPYILCELENMLDSLAYLETIILEKVNEAILLQREGLLEITYPVVQDTIKLLVEFRKHYFNETRAITPNDVYQFASNGDDDAMKKLSPIEFANQNQNGNTAAHLAIHLSDDFALKKLMPRLTPRILATKNNQKMTPLDLTLTNTPAHRRMALQLLINVYGRMCESTPRDINCVRERIDHMMIWATYYAKLALFTDTWPAQCFTDLQLNKKILRYLSEKNTFEDHLNFWVGYSHAVLGVPFNDRLVNPIVWANATALAFQSSALVPEIFSDRMMPAKMVALSNEGTAVSDFLMTVKTNAPAFEKLLGAYENATLALINETETIISDYEKKDIRQPMLDSIRTEKRRVETWGIPLLDVCPINTGSHHELVLTKDPDDGEYRFLSERFRIHCSDNFHEFDSTYISLDRDSIKRACHSIGSRIETHNYHEWRKTTYYPNQWNAMLGIIKERIEFDRKQIINTLESLHSSRANSTYMPFDLFASNDTADTKTILEKLIPIRSYYKTSDEDYISIFTRFTYTLSEVARKKPKLEKSFAYWLQAEFLGLGWVEFLIHDYPLGHLGGHKLQIKFRPNFTPDITFNTNININYSPTHKLPSLVDTNAKACSFGAMPYAVTLIGPSKMAADAGPCLPPGTPGSKMFVPWMQYRFGKQDDPFSQKFAEISVRRRMLQYLNENLFAYPEGTVEVIQAIESRLTEHRVSVAKKVFAKLAAPETDLFQQTLIAIDAHLKKLIAFISWTFPELLADQKVQRVISELYNEEKITQFVQNYIKNPHGPFLHQVLQKMLLEPLAQLKLMVQNAVNHSILLQKEELLDVQYPVVQKTQDDLSALRKHYFNETHVIVAGDVYRMAYYGDKLALKKLSPAELVSRNKLEKTAVDLALDYIKEPQHLSHALQLLILANVSQGMLIGDVAIFLFRIKHHKRPALPLRNALNHFSAQDEVCECGLTQDKTKMPVEEVSLFCDTTIGNAVDEPSVNQPSWGAEVNRSPLSSVSNFVAYFQRFSIWLSGPQGNQYLVPPPTPPQTHFSMTNHT